VIESSGDLDRLASAVAQRLAKSSVEAAFGGRAEARSPRAIMVDRLALAVSRRLIELLEEALARDVSAGEDGAGAGAASGPAVEQPLDADLIELAERLLSEPRAEPWTGQRETIAVETIEI
jgi:hypothetical protein